MLVEINLLTEKEKKDVTKWLIAGIIVFLLAASFLALKFYGDHLETEAELIHSEKQTITEQIIELQEAEQEPTISYFELLNTTTTKLEHHVIPASKLLAEVVRLLPEHGYFLTFDFAQPDEIYFNARFSQFAEVAAYTYALNESPYVWNVTLYNITTNDDFVREMNVNEQVEDEEADSLEQSETSEPFFSDQILPRYEAYFQLKINRDAFRVKEEG